MAAVPGHALVTYQFEKSNIKLMAYAHTQRAKPPYLLVLGGSPGLHAVTGINIQIALWMVWEVLLKVKLIQLAVLTLASTCMLNTQV